MSRFIQPRDLLLVLLSAALAVAVALLWLRPAKAPEKPKATADLGALQQSLEKAAETALPTPSLSNGQIAVKAGNASLADKAVEIQKMAGDFGGTGIVSDGGKKVGVLAKIPAAKAATFYQKLTGLNPPPEMASAGDDQWFDITVEK